VVANRLAAFRARSVPRTRHDAFVRHVFGRPLAAAIIFRRVLPVAMLAEVHIETLALASASYPRPSRTSLDSDLVFVADLHGPYDPEPYSVHLMLDHQSAPDELLPWRSHVYAGALWGRFVDAQPRRPRRLPFIIPVLLTQYPARHTPIQLSDILDLPDRVREVFGTPFEAQLYVDDLTGSVLDDSVAHPGHLALVEIARTVLYAYKNPKAVDDPRIPTLGPLFDVVLDCFGSDEIEEILSYVVHALGEDSTIFAIIMSTLGKAVREVYGTIADKLRDEGRADGHAVGCREGRARATAEILLRMLDHRGWPISASLRDRVLATSDEQLLQRWFDRAVTAGSLEEAFLRLDA
jgi:hypothetical protein